MWVMGIVTQLATLLITTHEPPSRTRRFQAEPGPHPGPDPVPGGPAT